MEKQNIIISAPSFFPQPPTFCISFINEKILSKQYCISPHEQAFLKQPYLAKVTTFTHTHTFENLNNANTSLTSYWDQKWLGFSLHYVREHLSINMK